MRFLAKKSRLDETMVRNHRSQIQILVIPDDQSEPRHYRIPVARLRLLRILGIVLAVHLITGTFAYFMLLHYMNKNSELTAVNNQLVANSEKVYELAALFQKLEMSDAKLRSALGLAENRPSISMDEQDITLPPIRTQELNPAREVKPERNAAAPAVELSDKLDFLQQSKNIGIHEYLKGVPTFLPVAGVLTTAYSSERSPAHYGIDIAAPRGTSIYAAGDGVVVFSGWTQDLGNMIIVYHGDGFFTYYGHNQRNLVQRNDVVHKGKTIALLGNSGKSTAPHLHFELWKDGVPLNPADYILAFSRM